MRSFMKRAMSLSLSVVMASGLMNGMTFQSKAASIAVPDWAEARLYFHTIGNNTTDKKAWAAMESTSSVKDGAPTIGRYTTASSYSVYLPSTAANKNNTYLVYNNYTSDITIGGVTVKSKGTAYVPTSATNVSVGSKSGSLKIYTSKAEENVYFTHTSASKNKSNKAVVSSDDFMKSLGFDYSIAEKDNALVTSPDITMVQADGTIDVSETGKQIKGRGNATWRGTCKKSVNFTLLNKYSVSGMKKGKKYSLLANFQDPSQSRDRFLYDLADSVGVPYSPDTRFADVYMDGLYVGSYTLSQKVDSIEGYDNTDIVYDEKGNITDAKFMVEVRINAHGAEIAFKPEGGGSVEVKLPDPEDLTSSEKSKIKTFVQNKFSKFYKELTNSNSTFESLSKYADVESLAKILLINELGKNYDSGVASFYLVYEKGKFYGAPAWDYDNSLGNANANPSGVPSYTSTSEWFCKYWKGGSSNNFAGNLTYNMAKNPAVLQAEAAVWFGKSINDPTSFVYNINKFANSSDTNITLGKDTGIVSKKYYLSKVKASASNNFTKWSIEPNAWCSGHSSLKMYTIDYKKLYDNLDTSDFTVSSKVSATSTSRSYKTSSITSTSSNGGQYEFAADYMISRAAWLSAQLQKTGGTKYYLTGSNIGWTTAATDYKLSATNYYSGIYAITDIDADAVTGNFKLNNGSAYIGSSATTDEAVVTETTYGGEKAYKVTDAKANGKGAFTFSNPDNWKKVSVFYKPADNTLWVTTYKAVQPVEATAVQFGFDNTGKIAGEDLNEYASENDTYTYNATAGKGTMTATITGTANKHISWSSDEYTTEDGTIIGIVPAIGASKSNNWSANAAVTVNTSTVNLTNLKLTLQMGATKKGPANYVFTITAGSNTQTLGTVNIAKNKTLYNVSFDIPKAFENKSNVKVVISLANTATVGGADLADAPTGGEFVVNKLAIDGLGYGVQPTVTPTVTPTAGPTMVPTQAPTQAPTAAPTQVPTQAPTTVPTQAPTQAPTQTPTQTPTTAPTQDPVTNTATVYYKRAENTSWTKVYAHYKVNGVWTKSPGVAMEKVSAGYWKTSIDLGKATEATICFNNGSGSWDSNDSKNYTVYEGTYLVDQTKKVIIKIDTEPTAVPTQVPTAVPTAVPTQVPTAVPTQVPTAVPTQVPTAVPTQNPDGNTLVVYYKRAENTSWTNAYAHYKVNGVWTKSPGVAMEKVSAGYWKLTIDLGTANEAIMCFNNGSGTWDNNNKNNYTLQAGTYVVDQTTKTITKA
ncbi:MAG: CotH kinase family protein [Lachnospiraceae bacterium]|nr:CotH kinase family protein [Lachnospiraceae bacterium]